MRYLALSCIALLCVSAVASADVVLDETWTTSRVYAGWNTLTTETAAPYSGANSFQVETLVENPNSIGKMGFMLTLDSSFTVNDLGGDPANVALKFMYKLTGQDYTVNMMLSTDNDYGWAPLNDAITLTATDVWTEATLVYSGWNPTQTYGDGTTTNVPTGDTSMKRLFMLQPDDFGSNVILQMDNVRVEEVPEPATMSLLAVAGLGLLRRRKR